MDPLPQRKPEHWLAVLLCRVDFRTQEHDPAAKDCHEDSQKLQEAVAQIFNVNGE